MNWSQWIKEVQRAQTLIDTPFYLFSWESILDNINRMQSISTKIPITFFYSTKTLPLLPIMQEWNHLGLSIEVVSLNELCLANRAGFLPENILINGPAKSKWLSEISSNHWLHIDSINEAYTIISKGMQKKFAGIGFRYAPSNMRDPDDKTLSGQFGLSEPEIDMLLKEFKDIGVSIDSIHFHLHSNVDSIEEYLTSIHEISLLCRKLNWYPKYIDIGGGVPSKHEFPRDQILPNWEMAAQLLQIDNYISGSMPWIEGLWVENGRSIVESACSLVLSVIDIKDRENCRYLICDSGKVNTALVAEWDNHDIEIIPERVGHKVFTSICGPTCMAWDWIDRRPMPIDICIDDLLIWRDCGAYHLPFETMFSHSLIPVLFLNDSLHIVRSKQSPADWISLHGDDDKVILHDCGSN